GEFTGYTHLDLSGEMTAITRHLETLGLHQDAFYSGYLASPAQVSIVMDMIDRLCDEGTHVFVDPAFADHGRLYSLMDSDMPRAMRELCGRADTIVPNLTEACFVLGETYRDSGYDEEDVRRLCGRLSALGPRNVVVTDVSFHKDRTGIAVYQEGECAFMDTPRFEGVFHGTGDVLASFLLAALLRGRTLTEAARLAMDCTHRAIEETLSGGEPLRYGVRFEQVLPWFIRELGL
ncbi:MAG: pyridoxal kinase, partial [Clostridia bacterium]|nr:pyridoxal kinase [Clostridia bacterium]